MALGELGKVAAVLVVMGFFLDALVLSGVVDFAGEGGAVEGLEIAGFICYMVALLLVLLAHYGGGDLRSNKIASIAACVFCFLAAVLIIIGLGIFGGASDSDPQPYPTTLLVISAALALIAGILSALNISRK